MVQFWQMSTVATVAIVDTWRAWTVATPSPGHRGTSKHRSNNRHSGRTIVTAFRLAAAGCRSSHGCDGNGRNRNGRLVCRVYQHAPRRNRGTTVTVVSVNRRNLSAGGALSVVADGDRKPDVDCIGDDCPGPLQANLVGPEIVGSRGIGRSGEEPTRLPGVAFDTVA